MNYNIKNQTISNFNQIKWNNYNKTVNKFYGKIDKKPFNSQFGPYILYSNNRLYNNSKIISSQKVEKNNNSINSYKFANLRRLSKNINLAILGKNINN